MSASSDNQNNQTNSGWQSTLAAPFQFILGFAISLFLIAGVGYASTWMTEGRCAICATDADMQNQDSNPDAQKSTPEPEAQEAEPEPDSAEEPQNDTESNLEPTEESEADKTQAQESESDDDSDANGDDSE